MGTQGRTGVSRIATAGRATERVVRLTKIPTLVIGGAEPGIRETTTPFHGRR